jgi:hypothetical protein
MPAEPGVLITADAQSIIFILHLNRSTATKFVLHELDATNVFVTAASVAAINARLQARLAETLFDEEEEP